MITATLISPTEGFTPVTVGVGTTLAALAAAHNFVGKEVTISGVVVPAASWNSYILQNGAQIFLGSAVKGN